MRYITVENPLAARAAGACILVADNNADMREYLWRLLSPHWQVSLAADGEAVLERAKAAPPDVILADVMMPNLDGFGLLQAVRADERLRTIPVIMLTARAGEEAAIEGLLADADDYVAKPFSARELVACVGAQLELARVRRESEMRLQLAAEAAQLGVFEWDLLTDRIQADARFRQLFGLDADREIVGAEFLAHRYRVGHHRAQALGRTPGLLAETQ